MRCCSSNLFLTDVEGLVIVVVVQMHWPCSSWYFKRQQCSSQHFHIYMFSEQLNLDQNLNLEFSLHLGKFFIMNMCIKFIFTEELQIRASWNLVSNFMRACNTIWCAFTSITYQQRTGKGQIKYVHVPYWWTTIFG